MVAVALLYGNLTADHYEDAAAADERIDSLRNKMTTREEPRFSKDYLDLDKRSIANSIDIVFVDGSFQSATVEYPIGHRIRREESISLLYEKFVANASTRLSRDRVEGLIALFQDFDRLIKMPVATFSDLFQLK